MKRAEAKQEFFWFHWTLLIVAIGNAIGINSPRLFEKLKMQDGK